MTSREQNRIFTSLFERMDLPVMDVAHVLQKYLFDNFRGTVKVIIAMQAERRVTIKAEWLAYFFKLLFGFADNNLFFKVELSLSESHLHIDILPSENIYLSERQLDLLLKSAKHAGFIIEFKEYKISLAAEAEFLPCSILSIYADNCKKLDSIFNNIFNNDW